MHTHQNYQPPEYKPFNEQQINHLSGCFINDLSQLPELKDDKRAKSNFLELIRKYETQFTDNYECQLQKNMEYLEKQKSGNQMQQQQQQQQNGPYKLGQHPDIKDAQKFYGEPLYFQGQQYRRGAIPNVDNKKFMQKQFATDPKIQREMNVMNNISNLGGITSTLHGMQDDLLKNELRHQNVQLNFNDKNLIFPHQQQEQQQFPVQQDNFNQYQTDAFYPDHKFQLDTQQRNLQSNVMPLYPQMNQPRNQAQMMNTGMNGMLNSQTQSNFGIPSYQNQDQQNLRSSYNMQHNLNQQQNMRQKYQQKFDQFQNKQFDPKQYH